MTDTRKRLRERIEGKPAWALIPVMAGDIAELLGLKIVISPYGVEHVAGKKRATPISYDV